MGGDLPAVFGHEVAGVVTDVGPAVPSTDLGEGDRVLVSLLRSCGRCAFCEAGIPTQCGAEYAIDSVPRLTDGEGRPVRAGLRVGGFAESVVVDSSQVVEIPAHVADEAACLISCGVMTGFGAAINTARVQVGDSVAVIGCGGVGLNCVQGAALAGALPLVAIDIAGDKLAQARAFGATETIDAAGEDVAAKALALTEGRGFDVVLTAVGSARAMEQGLALLARTACWWRWGCRPTTNGSRCTRPASRTTASASSAARWAGRGSGSTCRSCFACTVAADSSSTS